MKRHYEETAEKKELPKTQVNDVTAANLEPVSREVSQTERELGVWARIKNVEEFADLRQNLGSLKRSTKTLLVGTLVGAVGIGALMSTVRESSPSEELPPIEGFEPEENQVVTPREPERDPPSEEVESSEITESAAVPIELLAHELEIETQVLKTIAGIEAPRGYPEPFFNIWRGVVIAEIPPGSILQDTDGTRVKTSPTFVRLENPISVYIADETGDHDSLVLWAAYSPALQRFVAVQRGYETNNITQNLASSEVNLELWSLQGASHSGQFVNGLPLEIAGSSLRLQDSYAASLRNEGGSLFSRAYIYNERAEAMQGLGEILEFGKDDNKIYRDDDLMQALHNR